MADKILLAEFHRIFNSEDFLPGFITFEKNNKLDKLIPEIEKARKASKKHYFHKGGLWQHLNDTLASFEQIANRPDKFSPKKYIPIISGYAKSHLPLLRISALLHDIAKPETIKTINGRTRFFGHERAGAKTAAAVMKKLGFTESEAASAAKMIKYHMRPANLAHAQVLTKNAAFRFFRDIGEDSIGLLLLSYSDVYSYRTAKDNRKEEMKYRKFFASMLAYHEEYNRKDTEKKIIDGNMVMEQLSIQPGKLVGTILKFAEAQHAAGKIKTTEDALSLIRKKLPALKKQANAPSHKTTERI